MWIGLTGTPGTGKTSAADWLRTHGQQVVDLTRFAAESGCICGEDKPRDTKLVDMDCINDAILKGFKVEQTVIFEGHFAHLLHLSYIIILRCHPTTLRMRLQKKRYGPAKIKENVEAEILDVILCEVAELHPEDHCFEIDTTTLASADVGKIIQSLITTGFSPDTKYKIGNIDWSEEILRE